MGYGRVSFYFFLYKNNPKTMSDVNYKAIKYMNTEYALLAREEKPKKRERKKIPNRKGDGRWLEPKTNGRIGAPNPPLEGSLTSPY